MNDASRRRLDMVHPALATRIQALLDTLTQNGLQVEVVQGLRTFAEQDALFAQGRTRPGAIVTRARGGQSNHNYGLACFDEQTEVLTNLGWRRFADLDETESVMVFKNGKIFYEKPKAYIAYPYEGQMIAVKTRSVDLLTTPNHKFLIQKRYISDYGRVIRYDEEWSEVLAEDLTPYCRIPTAGEFIGQTEIDYPLKDKIDPETWWTFMGWYISEGSAAGVSDGVRRTHNSRNKVKISQYKSSLYWSEIDGLLNALPYRHKYQGHDFILDSKELWGVVFPSGNCYQKRIPRYLLNAPLYLLECLFHGLIKGDGTYYSGHETYWTVNKGLADDFAELCVKLGIATSIEQRESHESFNSVTGRPVISLLPQYGVRTRRRQTQELRNGEGKIRITREIYSGFVYCVTTDAGALVIRRSGKVAICGNCDLVPFNNGQPNWNAPLGVWTTIGTEAEKIGLEWGGDWKKFVDKPHVQLPGLSIAECLALYRKGGNKLDLVWAEATRRLLGAPAAPATTPAQPAAPAGGTGISSSHPLLRLNARGDAVRALQEALAAAGFLSAGSADGIFGSGTLAAVKKFQQSKGLTTDGVVGPATWESLLSTPSAMKGIPKESKGMVRGGAKKRTAKKRASKRTAKKTAKKR